MSERAGDAAARLGLEPDPVAGWFGELAGSGDVRRYHLLIAGGQELPWHEVPAEAAWHWVSGGTGSLSFAEPGGTVGAVHLKRGTPPALIAAGTRQTADSLGGWTLFEVAYAPGLCVTERVLAPDDWFPAPAAPSGRGSRP